MLKINYLVHPITHVPWPRVWLILKHDFRKNKCMRGSQNTHLECMGVFVRIVRTSWTKLTDGLKKKKLCSTQKDLCRTWKFHCELNFHFFSETISVGSRTAFWPFYSTLRVFLTVTVTAAHWGVSRALAYSYQLVFVLIYFQYYFFWLILLLFFAAVCYCCCVFVFFLFCFLFCFCFTFV